MPEPRLLKVGEVITEASGIDAADCIVVESDTEAERVIRAGADPSRVVTVPPAVDREDYGPEGEAASGPQGTLRILWIGTEDAGQVQAAASMPGVKVAGPLLADWLSNVEAPGPEWFRWADVVLFTGEPPVLAMARALACGRPCLAPDNDAAREVLTDKWDSLLYAPGKLADAVSRLADVGLRARLAAPARTSSERFDAATVRDREQALMRVLAMKDWPRVSVVLPTYKRGHLIEAAVRNVLEQDYPNLELIVVNDGSPDDTRERLERLQAELADARLKVIHRENGGLPRALNTGFEAATGEFWTWTSDDNAYKPGALRALARELLLDAAVGFVHSDMEVFDGHGHRRVFRTGPNELLRERCVVSACFMYRRSVAEKVGSYDPDYRLVEDYDYWLRTAKVTTLMILRRDLYLYADSEDSLSRTRYHQVISTHIRLLRREFGHTKAGDDNVYGYLFECTSWNKNSRRHLLSARLAGKMIRLRPFARRGWWALLRALTPMPILNLTRRLRGLDEA